MIVVMLMGVNILYTDIESFILYAGSTNVFGVLTLQVEMS